MFEPTPTLCTSLKTLLNAVETIRERLAFEPWENPWYRGQGDAEHDLMPSLFRKETLISYCKAIEAPEPTDDCGAQQLLARLESDAYFEFVQHMGPATARPRTAWDTLFLMRHYGIPTRTLDWTETLGVALYFAHTQAPRNTTSALWVLNPFKMNSVTRPKGVRDTVLPRFLLAPGRNNAPRDYDHLLAFSDHESFTTGHAWPFRGAVAVHPEYRNDRMHAQSGTFTVHSGFAHALNKLNCNSEFVSRIDLHPDIRLEVAGFLDQAGISERSLFPGLEGLTRDMKRKYG